MFMANGTQIKNPAAYVAKIQQNGYTKPLYTATGQAIKNPVAYVQKNAKKGDNKKLINNKRNGAGLKGKQMFQENGSAIRDTKKVLATIEKTGYTKPLFTAEGKLIHNPLAFAGSAPVGGRATQQKDMFKADGTVIRNTAKVLEAIEKKGYTEQLYTAEGKPIKNPAGFVGSPAIRAGEKKNAASVEMFKADGSQIRNPEKVCSAIEKNGYTEKLFTADGQAIKNPLAYAKLGASKKDKSGNKVRKVPLGQRLRASIGKRSTRAESAKVQMFKADGSQIRDVKKVLQAIDKNGYTELLYTAEGKPINNPSSFAKGAKLNRPPRKVAPKVVGRKPIGKRVRTKKLKKA